MKRLKRFTWIKTCHDGSLPFRFDEMSAAEKRRVTRAVAAVDTLVVSSKRLGEFFCKRFAVEPRYISPLMPLSTAFKVQRPEPRETANAVISIGAFIPSYGFEQVAKAMEQIRSDGTDVTLTLLDGSFARDEEYKRKVLTGRAWITVHEGVPHAEVGKFLASSDAFVRSFAHESYGLSRVEAIMSGTPVVATNIGETRGMLMYEFGDIDTLAAHVRRALDGRDNLDLQHWADVYTREADANLREYLRLITGDANA
jgi:glycosyltransferase involved in cell wall biosynthesis